MTTDRERRDATDAWTVQLREQQLRDLRAQLAVATKRAEAAEADAKTQRAAKDAAIARNGELHRELHAMRKRTETAEAKLVMVDEYAAVKLEDPYNDSLTFESWLQSRA